MGFASGYAAGCDAEVSAAASRDPVVAAARGAGGVQVADEVGHLAGAAVDGAVGVADNYEGETRRVLRQ